MNMKINPAQAIINTDAYLGVQMIKSSRYLNRSITPAQPFLKRNLYQGCKWSSLAETSTGLSHLPNSLSKGIPIRGANDQVQPMPKPVHHTCLTHLKKILSTEKLSSWPNLADSRALFFAKLFKRMIVKYNYGQTNC